MNPRINAVGFGNQLRVSTGLKYRVSTGAPRLVRAFIHSMQYAPTAPSSTSDNIGTFQLYAPHKSRFCESILLVDDDPSNRKITALALTCLGHSVISVESGEAALRMAAVHPNLRLLVTDVHMPQMNGLVLAAKLRRLHPGLQVLFCSGHTTLMEKLAGDDLPECGFLAKPLNIVRLSAKIKELLAHTPPSEDTRFSEREVNDPGELQLNAS